MQALFSCLGMELFALGKYKMERFGEAFSSIVEMKTKSFESRINTG